MSQPNKVDFFLNVIEVVFHFFILFLRSSFIFLFYFKGLLLFFGWGGCVPFFLLRSFFYFFICLRSSSFIFLLFFWGRLPVWISLKSLCGWVVVGGVESNFSVSFGPKPWFRLWIWTWTKLNNCGHALAHVHLDFCEITWFKTAVENFPGLHLS